ncbi:MAG TPA: S9 family peptidase, partial [Vicinamibacterales bacterium]|nr:S9 family peptidase [Vicinamibacterales bacterium]
IAALPVLPVAHVMLFCHIASFRTACRLATSVLALACGVAALSAQQPPAPQPITLVQLAELPRLIDPQLSPDGKSVAYMLATADWAAGRQVFHLWRQSIAGGAPVPLTPGTTGDAPGSTRWSPDSSSILFARAGQLMLLSVNGAASNEPHAVTKHAIAVSSPSWSPDGTTIYFLAADAVSAIERDRDRRKDDIYAFEENSKLRQLWSVSVSTGVERQLTSGDLSVASYQLSRDGRTIVLERAPSPLADDAHKSEIWLMDADGSHARQLTHNNVEEKQPELSPDGSQILFLSDTNEKFEPHYNMNLFVMPASGGMPKAVISDFQYAVDQAAWAPDGASILAVVNMGVHTELFQFDLSSKHARPLTDGRHFIPPSWNVVASAGKMIFQFDEPTRFGDVWTLAIPGHSPSTAAAPVRVTGVYDTLTTKYAMPRQEKMTWKGADGTTIEGLLFYPSGYVEGRRYPLVVQMHGGPAESDKFGAGPGLLLSYFPVLTGRGWFVFRPNYRGSTGYGNAFLRGILNGYFRQMPWDVISGVDTLIRQGLVDPDRMVVMGWSAGGHLTNKLVTMTTRFKAASAGASAANWLSMYSQSDQRDDRTLWFGGTPYQRNAPIIAYWNDSPMKDAANVKTPTLLFVGENDARVPKEQSIEMVRALRANGVPTHLYIAPREAHQWAELRHQIFKANTEMAWFERYALGRTYVPEQAPNP